MSGKIFYEIEQEQIDVKTYLRKYIGISAKALTKLKSSGIFVNEQEVTVRKIMKKGDILSLVLEQPKQTDYIPENIPLDIVYDDDNFIVINKPPYMAVYPAGEHMQGSVLNGFAYKYPNVTFRPIYRLDRNTSGLLFIAKNKMVCATKIEKEYIAVCQGETPEHLFIDKQIGLAEGSRIKRCTGYGQEAQTELFTVATYNNHSLVKVKIYTGRTHQIRVHLSSEGFPLAGDDLYGGNTCLIKRHALHCHKIIISNEALGIKKEIQVGVPLDMKENFKELFK